MLKHGDEESYKIILLGNSATGKTSIVERMRAGTAPKELQPTIGCNSTDIMIHLNDSTIRLKVWDTAGQEEYKSIVPIYTRGAHLALLVFDITNFTTLQDLEGWKSILLENEQQDIPLFIVGNKIDLVTDHNVSFDLAHSYANKYGGELMLVSALTGENIEFLFNQVAEAVSKQKSFERDPTAKAMKPNESSGCC